MIPLQAEAEEFSGEVARRMLALNAVVAAAGEPVEGNLCYGHHLEAGWETHLPRRNGYRKRDNLRYLASKANAMLEIGVNAGHSALISLNENPGLYYCGVDIGKHAYTKPAMDHLSREFPGRTEWHIGSSFHMLPKLAVLGSRRYDLIHIDGDHRAIACQTDFFNATRLLSPGGIIIIDDMALPAIATLFQEFLSAGLVVAVEDPSLQNASQAIVRLGPAMPEVFEMPAPLPIGA